jgi:hypothetical protein
MDRNDLIASMIGALGILLVDTLAQQALSAERVTHSVSGNTETWRIDEPNVKQGVTPYPQILFQPGDQVRVGAGGCVQMGGWGDSWKRYVDPLPADRGLYHGLVLIPGAIGRLPASVDNAARILIVRGTTFTVQGITEPRKAHLWLGYEDDDYDDNGYWGQDEGTQGQCKIGNAFLEHAFVLVTIVHGPAPQPTAGRPFDLVLDKVDDNRILYNPKWAWQLPPRPPFPNAANFPDPIQQCNRAPYSSACTSQPTTEDNGTLCTLHGNDGHHNWAAGTYEGTIFWNNHSCNVCDDDYNFRLVPPEGAGLTAQNGTVSATQEKSMKLEFDADETINHFRTPWWDSFHKAVDESFSAANAMVFKKHAIVTGLIGLDCAHSCASELHPVWAMAIRVKDDPDDEVWAIFVRRWGNEGFCSDHQHYLDDLQGDEFVFRLPWRSGASTVSVSPTTIFNSRLGQASGPNVVWSANSAVLVSFTLPVAPSIVGERVNGELHLRWTPASPNVPVQPPIAITPPAGDSATTQTVTTRPDPIEEDEPEDRLAKLLANMTGAQRDVFDARIPQKTISIDSALVRPTAAPREVPFLVPRLGRGRQPKVRAEPDPQKKARNEQLLDALRASGVNP